MGGNFSALPAVAAGTPAFFDWWEFNINIGTMQLK